MIVFCEDCGRKNTLHQLTGSGKAAFTCDACGYRNNYALPGTHPNPLETLHLTLQSIRTAEPSVIGYFILQPDGNLAMKEMPDNLTATDLRVLGQLLFKSFDLCEYPDLTHIRLCIGEKHLAVFVNKNAWVLVVVTTSRGVDKQTADKLHQQFCIPGCKGVPANG